MKAEKYISGANTASVYAASGAEEKEIEWLEIALDERDLNLSWIKSDKEIAGLEEYPRFKDMLKEAGLAEKIVKLAEKRLLIYAPESL